MLRSQWIKLPFQGERVGLQVKVQLGCVCPSWFWWLWMPTSCLSPWHVFPLSFFPKKKPHSSHCKAAVPEPRNMIVEEIFVVSSLHALSRATPFSGLPQSFCSCDLSALLTIQSIKARSHRCTNASASFTTMPKSSSKHPLVLKMDMQCSTCRSPATLHLLVLP